MAKTLITIDNSFGILAGDEDLVLVHEIVRHFTERWRGEAAESKDYNLSKSVDTMLNKISIEHEMVAFDNMNVLTGAAASPAKSAEPAVKPEPAAKADAPKPEPPAGGKPDPDKSAPVSNPMLAH